MSDDFPDSPFKEKHMVKKITALLALAGLVTLLGACNTIAGVGKDVEAAGSAVDKAATDTKKKM